MQQTMAQIAELLLIQEIRMRFLVPAFHIAQLWLLVPFEKWISGYISLIHIFSFSLSSLPPLTSFLCHCITQIFWKRNHLIYNIRNFFPCNFLCQHPSQELAIFYLYTSFEIYMPSSRWNDWQLYNSRGILNSESKCLWPTVACTSQPFNIHLGLTL